VLRVHDGLRETAARASGRRFVVAEDRTWTFGEVDDATDRVAAHLQRRGLSRGDRVALCGDNTAEFVVALFGVAKAGGVVVPVSPLVRAGRMAAILADAGPRFLIAASRLGSVVAEALARAGTPEAVWWLDGAPADGAGGRPLSDALAGPRAAPSDPGVIDHDLFAILYTSGSTGRPKGVMLTHRNLVNTTGAIATYLGNTADDVVACVLPLTHTYGLCQVLVASRVGHAVVLERSFAFPRDVLRRMREHEVTGFPAVPTVCAQLLEVAATSGLELPSLRYLTNAAAGLPAAHVPRLQALFPAARLYLMYGQTECTRVCYLDPARALERPTSVGRPIPNCEAWVVDEHGRRAPPGAVGELVVRGANVMRGYWGLAEETARVLRDGPIAGEKVLHTGDRFRTDEEGLLHFVGRSDDVFKTKGEKVVPSEIENVLHELEDVSQAAVVGVEDPIDGRAIVAHVVLRPGSTLREAELRRHCRARLESYLVPKAIEIRASLPVTEGGKPDRRALAVGAERTLRGHA
jgi:amino acid adenylation domain-containing protein